MLCGAQTVGPTPQPQGVPVTPDQAEQVQPGTWAVHAHATITGLLQPAFRSPYQGPQSLSPAANGRETIDATLYASPLGYPATPKVSLSRTPWSTSGLSQISAPGHGRMPTR